MPAIITHHLFGEDAANRLPQGYGLADEELLAFLLGNQGPVPFCFCFTDIPTTIRSCHKLGAALRGNAAIDICLSMWQTIAHLPFADRTIGRAFVLGMLAHYLLESEGWAFVHAQELALFAVDESLCASQAQVRALIESELDTWMLWSARQQTIADSPVTSQLARTERITRIAGALFSQVGWQILSERLEPQCYSDCMSDYELIYRTIDPAGNPRGRVVSWLERLGARHSLLDALAHTEKPSDQCPAANLECRPWVDPLTHEVHTTSFPDVFYDSLEVWPTLVEAFELQDRPRMETLLPHLCHQD